MIMTLDEVKYKALEAFKRHGVSGPDGCGVFYSTAVLSGFVGHYGRWISTILDLDKAKTTEARFVETENGNKKEGETP